jgi:hypothetical protein
MSYEGNMKLNQGQKNNLKNNATTLPTIITQFLKKTPTNMVQTNQSRLLALIVTKDSYKDNFSFKIKDQKKDTLSITLFKTAH